MRLDDFGELARCADQCPDPENFQPERSTVLMLHIPKTAGMTLMGIVKKNYARRERAFLHEPSREQNEQLLQSLDKRSLRFVQGHFAFGLHKYFDGPTTYATFLRDPMRRMVSNFNHVCASQSPNHRRLIGRAPTFDEFSADHQMYNLQTRLLIDWPSHRIKQDEQGAVRAALSNLNDHFLFIGVAERFDHSLAVMAQHLCWKRRSYWRMLNRAERRSQQLRLSDLDESSVEIIRANTRCDQVVYQFAQRRLDAQLRILRDQTPETVPSPVQRITRWLGNHLFKRRAA